MRSALVSRPSRSSCRLESCNPLAMKCDNFTTSSRSGALGFLCFARKYWNLVLFGEVAIGFYTFEPVYFVTVVTLTIVGPSDIISSISKYRTTWYIYFHSHQKVQTFVPHTSIAIKTVNRINIALSRLNSITSTTQLAL